ncbi:ABC transporter [Methanobrevibacter sp. YE315]|uniref:YhgE/Pip domain-containing protein n=1 Tax=Methanobrevibacter sp. YE315 TaxID=1609968 RepID=UPI000764DFB4|nr:YhgE/Pip domain-containing protein [Methanobrevibacter sp. YE315]AMD17150.1 ABC transporter [Methanobrevibacter sp. YE315]
MVSLRDILEFRKNTRENIFEILKLDLKSTTANPIVVLVLIAIMILPSLYGLINIYACWDPYENTDHVQFAIANEDKGAIYQGMKIDAGKDLVDMLKNNTDFEWVFVSSDELREGVHNGKYYAGMVVPANFSQSIVSITTDKPHSAILEYYVNEKTNPVAAKLADAAAKAVYNNINAEIVTFINVAAYDKLGELQDGLASGASQLSSGAVLLSNGAGQVSSGAGQVAGGANQLSSGAHQLSSGASELAGGASQVADGTHQVSTKANEVSTAVDDAAVVIKDHTSSPIIHEVVDNISTKVSNVSGRLNDLDNGAHAVSDGAYQLSGGANDLATGSDELASGTLSLAAGAELLANSAASALFTASSSLAGAAAGLDDVTGLNESQVGDYFYSPVKLDRHEEFPTHNYGSQVSPFYLVLCMWVGALITCVMLKTGTSIGTKYRPHEMYLAKLSLFSIIAILQTTITLLGCYLLGIDIHNHLVFILSCYFVAVIFMGLIYSLISVLGDVGKGIAIILLVFQISGTGGIYPVEIMNKIFGVLYPYLPMTHAINIVREAQLGLIWANYIPSFLILLGLGMAVVLISIILKRSFDKRTKYFEEKLEESNLFN